MYGDETELPKPEPQNPDEALDNDEPLEEELTEEEEEEQARAENGEVCADCGAEFADANGSPALCADCFATAESLTLPNGIKHPPLSQYPVTNA